MAETKGSPQLAPGYALYREVDANDPASITDRSKGINMGDHRFANIQVVPSGGANPAAEVLWWSEEASAFIPEHTALTFAAKGANTSWETSVECRGRIMFVKLSSISAGLVKVFVGGSSVDKR